MNDVYEFGRDFLCSCLLQQFCCVLSSVVLLIYFKGDERHDRQFSGLFVLPAFEKYTSQLF